MDLLSGCRCHAGRQPGICPVESCCFGTLPSLWHGEGCALLQARVKTKSLPRRPSAASPSFAECAPALVGRSDARRPLTTIEALGCRKLFRPAMGGTGFYHAHSDRRDSCLCASRPSHSYPACREDRCRRGSRQPECRFAPRRRRRRARARRRRRERNRRMGAFLAEQVRRRTWRCGTPGLRDHGAVDRVAGHPKTPRQCGHHLILDLPSGRHRSERGAGDRGEVRRFRAPGQQRLDRNDFAI